MIHPQITRILKLLEKGNIIIALPITNPAWWLHGSGCLSLRVRVWTPWAFKWRLHQGGELLFAVTSPDIEDNKVLFLISILRGSWAKPGRVRRMFTNAAGALLKGGSWCTMWTCSAPMLRWKSQICMGHTTSVSLVFFHLNKFYGWSFLNISPLIQGEIFLGHTSSGFLVVHGFGPGFRWPYNGSL